MISGLLIMLISLILLLRMSGHAYRKSKEIRLLRSDRFGPEANVLICALMIIVCLFLSDQIGKRLLHILIPQTFWAFSTRMLSYVIIYLCVLTASFSVIREAKAGILWKNSSLKHLVRDITEFLHDISIPECSRSVRIYCSGMCSCFLSRPASSCAAGPLYIALCLSQ